MTKSTAKLLSEWRPPKRPPLTREQAHTAEVIGEYLYGVELRFGAYAKWICAARLQQHYGSLVSRALGFPHDGQIVPHDFYNHRQRRVVVLDERGPDGIG
jgi:hypothetical protein